MSARAPRDGIARHYHTLRYPGAPRGGAVVGSVARHEGRGVLDVVSRMSVLLCLGLYGGSTTALTCAMHDKIQSIR
jgi:hypothetical protein